MARLRSIAAHDDKFTRALLRSAESDEPSNAAYAKVAAALGVSAGIGLGASVPAPAALAASASGVSSGVRWLSSALGKVVAVSVSGAFVALGSVALLRQQRPDTHAKSTVAAAPSKPAAPAAARAMTLSASEIAAPGLPSTVPALVDDSTTERPAPVVAKAAPVLAKPAPVLGVAGNALGSRVSATARAAQSSSSLPAQVLSLDRARVALGSADANAALLEIAHYRSTWPHGVFLTEASVLEIEALAKRGDRSLAVSRARAFVTAHPDSPQAERLRALIRNN